MADTGVFRLSWKLEEVPMVMGGGGAVRPAGGSAHPHPLAAQVRHDYSQQEPGTRNQEPVLHKSELTTTLFFSVFKNLSSVVK